jgi:predicted metalloprotease with PDZ domain
MRGLYQSAYKQGRGFTAADWWSAVSRAAGGRSFTDFATRYVDGRETYPWDRILPLAGLHVATDTIREPRLGITTGQDSSGAIVVRAIQPGSAAADAGVQAGDILLELGDLAVTDPSFAAAYRARFGKNEGDSLPIRVSRNGQALTLHSTVRLVTHVEGRIAADSAAGEKAARIREGILTGKTE